MEESTSKEKVLKNVREALISRTDQPYPNVEYDKPVFREMEETPDINFAQELTNAGGLFIYCETMDEVINGLNFLVNDRKWDHIFAMEPAIIDILHKAGIKCHYDHVQLTDAHVGMT